MYDKGLDVPQDYTEALKWYRLAAAQGNAGAVQIEALGLPTAAHDAQDVVIVS
jgi:TPR repeat protein